MGPCRLLGGLLILIAMGVGCSGEPPASPTTDQLAGSWALLSIQPAGQTELPTPTGASYFVSFADGRVTVRADCNTCNGVFSLSGSTLTAGPTLICTRAACPTMAFENLYTQILAGDSTVTLTGTRLMLTSSRGILRFNR